MKKLITIFICIVIALFCTGCMDGYPRVQINPGPWSNVFNIDLGNHMSYRTFERIDDEEGTKLILYFDKASEKEK